MIGYMGVPFDSLDCRESPSAISRRAGLPVPVLPGFYQPCNNGNIALP